VLYRPVGVLVVLLVAHAQFPDRAAGESHMERHPRRAGPGRTRGHC